MRQIPTPYKRIVLVCENRRENGEQCCAGSGSEGLRAAIKAKVKALGLPVRVSRTGCMGMCATGPTVVIMPDGIWLGGVTEADVDAVVAMLVPARS